MAYNSQSVSICQPTTVPSQQFAIRVGPFLPVVSRQQSRAGWGRGRYAVYPGPPQTWLTADTSLFDRPGQPSRRVPPSVAARRRTELATGPRRATSPISNQLGQIFV